MVSCAACAHQRRKCTHDCDMAPYFPANQPDKFTNVHKLFGRKNVSKILKHLNDPRQREEAVNSLIYEAEVRAKNPVYGSLGIITGLQHRINQTHLELEHTKKQLSLFPYSSQCHNNPFRITYSSVMGMPPPRQPQLVIREPPMLNAQQKAAREQQQLLYQHHQLLRFHDSLDAGASTSGVKDVQQQQEPQQQLHQQSESEGSNEDILDLPLQNPLMGMPYGPSRQSQLISRDQPHHHHQQQQQHPFGFNDTSNASPFETQQQQSQLPEPLHQPSESDESVEDS